MGSEMCIRDRLALELMTELLSVAFPTFFSAFLSIDLNLRPTSLVKVPVIASLRVALRWRELDFS